MKGFFTSTMAFAMSSTDLPVCIFFIKAISIDEISDLSFAVRTRGTHIFFYTRILDTIKHFKDLF